MKVKLGMTGLSPLEMIVKAVFINGKLTGNSFYTSPLPSLANIQTKVDELVDALSDAESGDHDKVSIKNQVFKDLKLMLTQLAAYVQSTSDGVGLVIESSGFEVITKGGPIGPLEKVGGLSAKGSDFMGQLDCVWDTVPGKDLYVIEKNSGDPNNEQLWHFAGYSTKTKFSITGLQTGSVNWVRVSAVGAAGKGPSSDPARGVPS